MVSAEGIATSSVGAPMAEGETWTCESDTGPMRECPHRAGWEVQRPGAAVRKVCTWCRRREVRRFGATAAPLSPAVVDDGNDDLRK